MAPSPPGYGPVRIALHWGIAALVAVQIAAAGGMAADFADGMETARRALSGPALVHMKLGGLLLVLVLWRLALWWEEGAPPLPGPRWRRLLARTVQGALSVVLLALPLVGTVAWGLGSAGAAHVHRALVATLLALVALHVAGALHGQVLRRDGTLARMLRPTR